MEANSAVGPTPQNYRNRDGFLETTKQHDHKLFDGTWETQIQMEPTFT